MGHIVRKKAIWRKQPESAFLRQYMAQKKRSLITLFKNFKNRRNAFKTAILLFKKMQKGAGISRKREISARKSKVTTKATNVEVRWFVKNPG